MGVRKALILSAGASYTALIIQVVSTMVLARLLSPAEIGVYSVCAAFVSIAHSLRDFGVTSYLVQEKELTKDRISTALGITLGFSWFLALIVACLAHPFALFYDEQGIRAVLFVLAVNFVFIPFGSVYLALFRREMQFGTLWRISTLSVVVHAATSVGLAALGLSYMSLAWAAVAGTLTTVFGVTVARRGNGIIMPSLRERARVFGFGYRLGIASIATDISNGAPDMVIGRLIGFNAVGLFSRAIGYVSLFERSVLDVIGGVALPHFSGLHREGVSVGGQYVRALEYIIAVAWPVMLFLALMASPMIEIMFGAQWVASVPLAQILAIGIGLRCMNPTIYAILVAKGAVSLVMRTQLTFQVARVAFVVVGAMHSLEAVAWGFVAGEFIGVFLFARAVNNHDIGRFKDYILAGTRGGIIAMFSVLPILVFEVLGVSQHISQIKLLFWSAPLVTVAWFAALWLFHSPLKMEVSRSVIMAKRSMKNLVIRKDELDE